MLKRLTCGVDCGRGRTARILLSLAIVIEPTSWYSHLARLGECAQEDTFRHRSTIGGECTAEEIVRLERWDQLSIAL